jgi:hypothetical protein
MNICRERVNGDSERMLSGRHGGNHCTAQRADDADTVVVAVCEEDLVGRLSAPRLVPLIDLPPRLANWLAPEVGGVGAR